MKLSRHGKIGAFTSFRITKAHGGDTTCQEEIDNEIDNSSERHTWLQLKRVLQNIKGKGIATMMGHIDKAHDDVLIKVQLTTDALREYNIQQRIKNIDGIVPYTCFVTCGGDKKYIEEYGPPLKPYQKLCTKKGSELGIIIMPYFPLGSFESYLKHDSDVKKTAVVKLIVCKSIYTLYKVYSLYGFVHGDFFTKNIVMRDLRDPILIDFEKSSFNDKDKLSLFWRDIDCLLGDVSTYMFRTELSAITHKHVIMSRAYNKEPTSTIIADICRDLQKIT